jgi:AcrR family transcriptional regulator
VTAALADPPVLVGSPLPGIEERAVAATLVCIARQGIGKTTIDDIAREAGCSRATLYRYFGGKVQLVAAVLRSESDRVMTIVRSAVDDAATLEDAVFAILHTAATELAQHRALCFVAEVEPERLLPQLTFEGGDRFLASAAAEIAPSLERFAPGDANRAAEWVARVGLALWCSPTAPVSLTDEASLRDYVRAFILPALPPKPVPNPSRTPSPNEE